VRGGRDVIGVGWVQGFLSGIGAVLAWLYDLIPNYGVAIILLTLGIRVLLLPLAVKQIRSMQAMQAVAPKQKELQRKYKGNRQKIQEETMRLYKEEGVNPLSGCLPLLAQIPILFALYAVLFVPRGLPHVLGSSQQPTKLYQDILRNADGVKFLGANLVCSAREAGRVVNVPRAKNGSYPALVKNCGKAGANRIPYYAFMAAMVGTMFYQQKQMMRASPPGQSQQQQKIMLYAMPVFFLYIGVNFPAGLIVYWSTTNIIQIVQQHFMLPKTPAPAAGPPSKARSDGGKTAPRDKRSGPNRLTGKAGSKGSLPGSRQSRPEARGKGGEEGGKPRPQEGEERRSPGAGPGGQGDRAGRGPGGRDGGDRKKRRKR